MEVSVTGNEEGAASFDAGGAAKLGIGRGWRSDAAAASPSPSQAHSSQAPAAKSKRGDADGAEGSGEAERVAVEGDGDGGGGEEGEVERGGAELELLPLLEPAAPPAPIPVDIADFPAMGILREPQQLYLLQKLDRQSLQSYPMDASGRRFNVRPMT